MKQSRGVVEGSGRYRRIGEGDPVLILSNPQANPEWWASQVVELLVEAGFEAITFIHEGSAYDPPSVVHDVKRVIDHLGLKDVRLLGWSQGAAIAQEVALAYPGTIRSAALIATYGRQNCMDQVLQEAWDVLSVGGQELDPVRLAMGLLTSHPAHLLGSDAFVSPLIGARAEWASTGATSIEARKRSAAFIRAYQERLEPLSRTAVPCLVIGFEQDTDTFEVRAQEVADAIPESRYIGFPGAGHLEPVIHTTEVMEPIIQFFRESPQCV
ncbi:alpha/beta hydrolase [Arthrobacter tumbae]|uniref:alpha/beta fold hydrolase n=1 Tax=Arthrobacter tumbae TaxID=163874 RepID=UPI0019575C5A|nr:alpha/beta hydrolase [Arthrobacter tumbae]MBM7781842.1 pimeloyl-ACP methyl ester carboxylesterase [Arthrobacter tumbae]